MPLKAKKREDSRRRWLPLRWRNAHSLLPAKQKIVAKTLATVTEMSSLSPAPECSAFAPPMVMPNPMIPTEQNLAASCMRTLKRV
jgi:hypothetical protein